MKRRKGTCRKVFAAALAVALAGSCLGYGSIGTETAQAADSEGTVTAEGPSVTVVPDASALADNDELFAGYAEDIFYGSSEIELLSSDYASNVLDDFNYQVYNELKAGVADIADGTVASTVMVLSDDTAASLSWTFSELGFDNVSTQAELEAVASELFSAANEMCESMIDIDLILQCLMADCPYELYWFDKTSGISCAWNLGASGTEVWVSDVTFTFYVESSYQDGANNKVNASKVDTAKAAAAYAAEIVQNYASATDTEKLEAYKDEICSLVSYNDEALTGGYTYDDPWELVYVFDQDEDTNVVCEGYSKAFQYLCELSDFSGDVSCYSVSGTMTGGTGEGPHMWNIVVLDGVNYMVDVTDSDEGTIGQNGELFLVTEDDASAYTAGESYTFTIKGNEISYTYDDDTIALYGSDILTLSAASSEDQTYADTLALRRDNTFFISYTLGGGTDLSFSFGRASDEILVGDWDGDGVDTICLRRGNIYYISNTLGGTADYYIKFGKDTDEVLVGDWDGDGVDTLCIRRDNMYYMSNSLTGGYADVEFAFGRATDEVLVGDWDGDGVDTLCIRRGSNYYMNNTLEGGYAAVEFAFGRATDEVLAGDWDGDGVDTLCIRRGNTYFINNTLKGGNAELYFTYGKSGDEVFAGKWN